MENPNVVLTYKKFKNKNFTVLGVSLDKAKDPWVKAINDDGLAWTQVSDLKYWYNEAAAKYHIQTIPQNLLVDPNGRSSAAICEVRTCRPSFVNYWDVVINKSKAWPVRLHSRRHLLVDIFSTLRGTGINRSILPLFSGSGA